MDNRESEAIAWLRDAVAKREAGVQHDKRHHERSACKFDVERARTHATIGGLRLDHGMALLGMVEAAAAERAKVVAHLHNLSAARDGVGDVEGAFWLKSAGDTIAALAHHEGEAG